MCDVWPLMGHVYPPHPSTIKLVNAPLALVRWHGDVTEVVVTSSKMYGRPASTKQEFSTMMVEPSVSDHDDAVGVIHVRDIAGLVALGKMPERITYGPRLPHPHMVLGLKMLQQNLYE